MTEYNIEIKPITLSDFLLFFKESPKRTIRGYSFFLDGKIVAVFGAILEEGGTMLFSDVKKEEINVAPIIIWRWAKRSLEKINDLKQPLYATSQNSGRFLKSLGFAFITDTRYGKLYQYLG